MRGDTHRTIAARSPEESFPDYRILFPAADRVRVRIGLNAGLLASLLNTIDTLAGRSIGVEFLVPGDAESPVELRVRGDNDEEIRALCMPVRLGKSSSAENREQELRMLLSQLDQLVSTEEFSRCEDLQTMVTEALAQLTATVAAAVASRPITCERCSSLSKMNWNDTQFDGGAPITITAARKVGSVLKYAGKRIAPRYSYYM